MYFCTSKISYRYVSYLFEIFPTIRCYYSDWFSFYFNDTKATTFSVTDTKLYVPVVTLSSQDNVKLFEQLKSGFKRTINWNKYHPKVLPEKQNQYLDFVLIQVFKE